MLVTIHQPDFIPWLGFFDRWKKSDLYIILDDVQFSRRGWHHRDKIKTADGTQWLTVPVIKKSRFDQFIRDVEISSETAWQRKHLRTIEMCYQRAPYFDRCFDMISSIYAARHNRLIDLNLEFLHFVGGALGITTPVVFASQYGVTTTGTHRLVDLVKTAGGHRYLTGAGSKAYLDETLFQEADVEVIWQDYQHPVYPQLYGAFVPMLSSLDYVMMEQGG